MCSHVSRLLVNSGERVLDVFLYFWHRCAPVLECSGRCVLCRKASLQFLLASLHFYWLVYDFIGQFSALHRGGHRSCPLIGSFAELPLRLGNSSSDLALQRPLPVRWACSACPLLVRLVPSLSGVSPPCSACPFLVRLVPSLSPPSQACPLLVWLVPSLSGLSPPCQACPILVRLVTS